MQFAVFSLGGGTFNISILEISAGVIEVKAKESDSSLRGEDFDLILVEYMVEEIRKVYSVDVSGDRVAMGRLQRRQSWNSHPLVRLGLISLTSQDLNVAQYI